MLDETGPGAADVVAQEPPGTGRAPSGPLLAWGFLAALALPVAVLLLVSVRGLTGHSPFLDGVPSAAYTRISAAVLGQGTASDLLPTLVGLAVLALLPGHGPWVPAAVVRRAAAGLAALVTLTAAVQTGLVAYLLLATPPSDNGITFVADGAKAEQLAGPLAGAVCAAVVAALLAAALLRGTRPDPTPALPAGPDPDARLPDEQPPYGVAPDGEPRDDVPPGGRAPAVRPVAVPADPQEPDPALHGQDPYARYRRPRS